MEQQCYKQLKPGTYIPSVFNVTWESFKVCTDTSMLCEQFLAFERTLRNKMRVENSITPAISKANRCSLVPQTLPKLGLNPGGGGRRTLIVSQEALKTWQKQALTNSNPDSAKESIHN
ncbi:hypothetical protein UY3_15550 [Chelonia mydas]|uniref:Uncharacterized protein n=1 Tax=Chelonia mydas TaxID=8469 RepID=M7AQ47_CHEMY|nr:hypothetical protein UY3_15550 [Chelonia mydas]